MKELLNIILGTEVPKIPTIDQVVEKLLVDLVANTKVILSI